MHSRWTAGSSRQDRSRPRPGGATARLLWRVLVPALALAGVLPALGTGPAATAADGPDELNVSRTGNESVWNRLASSDDDVYVVWQDRSYAEGGMGTIALRRSDDKGVTFAPTQLVSSGRHDAVHPAVAASGSHVYVVWQELDPSVDTNWQSDIWLARSDDHGVTFTITRLSHDRADSIDPVVAVDGDDGNDLAVVWSDSDDRIMAVTSTDGGETVQDAVLATGQDYSAHVRAAVSLGSVHAAWQHGREVTAGRMSLGDATGEAPVGLGAGFVDGIAAWGLGVHVLYRTQVDSGYAVVKVASSTDAGRSWMKPQAFDARSYTPAGARVAIAADGGEVAVTWGGRTSGGGAGAYVARSTDGGRSFTTATLDTSPTSGAFTDAGIAPLTHTLTGRKPEPALTWTVPRRFGDDADHDGLVDYLTTTDQVVSQTYPTDLDACGSDGGDSPIVAYRWEIEGDTATTEDCRLRHVFSSQGEHDVALTVTTADGDSETRTLPVKVEDLLVVSVGDSVASGEGDPDVPASLPRFWDGARWQMERCHRSALAGPALAAKRLEDADPQTSVTFLHLACSGATISEPDPEHGGLLTPYVGIDPPIGAEPMPPQLDQLGDLVTGASGHRRPVDAMFVSIGANDLKFSDVILACITGDCADPSNPVQAELARREEALPGRYDDLARWLRSYVPADRTFLTQYFDPTKDEKGDFTLGCVGAGGPIRATETVWAYDHVVVPLNDLGRAAAARNGWHYVDGIADAFGPHGYCASDPWVVRIGSSYVEQHGRDGSFHPTVPGHEVYGERLAAEAAPVLGLPGSGADPTAPVHSRRFAAVFSDNDMSLTVTPLDGSQPQTITAPHHPITGGLAVTGTDVGADVTWISYVVPGGGPGDGTTAPYEVYGKHVALGPGNLAVRSVQVVQAPDDATSLVAGKAAALRVEIFNGLDGGGRYVPLTYHLGRAGAEQTDTVQVGLHRGRNVVWVRPSPAYLPTEGDEVAASVSIPEDVADGGRTTVSAAALPVRSSRDLKVLYVPVAGPGEGPTCAAVQGVARDGGGFAAAAFPVPEGGMRTTVSCASALRAHVDTGGVDLVRTLRDLEGAARSTGFDAVVGVVPSGWFATHTTEKLNGGVGLVGGDSGPVDGASLVEAGVPSPVVAHELGHNLGLVHTGSTAAGYRFDLAEARRGDDLMDPVAHPQNWISDASFQRLRQRLQLSVTPQAPGGSLLVSGVLGEDGTVTAPAWERTDDAPDPAPASSTLQVAVRTADGDLVLTPIELSPAAGVSDVAVPGGRAFTARVPWRDGTVSVDLVDQEGRTLLSRTVSPAAPSVTVTFPSAGTRVSVGDTLPVTWTAQDADGGELTADVDLSTDGGTTWRPVATEVSTGSVDIPVTRDLTGRDVTVRVTVSDGINAGVGTAPAVTVEGGVANGRLAFAQTDVVKSVETVAPDGSDQQSLVPEGFWPAYSPDGRRLAYAAPYSYDGVDPDYHPQNILIADADGSDAKPLFATWTGVGRPSWSPDGRELVMENCITRSGVNRCGIWIVPVDGSAPRLVKEDFNQGSDFPDFSSPAWSPDGTHIVYEYRAANTNYDLHVIRTDGTGDVNASRFLPDGGLYAFEKDPAWSPDGSRVAFEYSRTGGGIAVMDADGHNMQVVVPDGAGEVTYPAWSPDGTRIAFSRWRHTTSTDWTRDLYTVRTDGSDEQRLTHVATGGSAAAATWQAVAASGEDPEPTPAPMSAGGPYAAVAGQPVTLSATLPGQDAAAVPLVAWDLDEDGEFDDADGVAPIATFESAGTRTVAVRVTDPDGTTRTAETTVEVTAAAPAVDAGADDVAAAGTPYSLGGATFRALAGGAYTATVAWGDAEPVAAEVTSVGGGHFRVAATRTLAAGTYDVVVTVCDAESRCGADSVTVTAEAAAVPVVTSISPAQGPRGTVVTVHGARLGGVTGVRFGDTAGSDVRVVSDREVRVAAPALADGVPVPVTVDAAGGGSPAAGAPTFVPRDRPPTVTTEDARTPVDTAVDLVITTADADGDEVGLALDGQPAHGTATVTDAGVVRYTPDAGFAGTDVVEVVADDHRGGATPATATVTVGSRAPVARPDLLRLSDSADSSDSSARMPVATLLANDVDPDGDDLTVTDVALMPDSTGSVTLDGEDLVYTAAAGATADRLRYKVRDTTGMTMVGEIEVAEQGAAPTTLTYTGPAHVQYSDELPVSLHLADSDGAGIAGATVTVTIGGVRHNVGPTDADGDATVAVMAREPGDLPVSLSYAGDATHAASAGTASVVVAKEDSVLTDATAAVQRVGRSTRLTAVLSELDDTPGDLSGHEVSFEVTRARRTVRTVTAVTDSAGRAKAVVRLRGGRYAIVERFAGDDRYLPSDADGSVTVSVRPVHVEGAGSIRTHRGTTRLRFRVDRDSSGALRGSLNLLAPRRGGGEDRFVARAVRWLVTKDDRVTWVGTGSWNGEGGYRFRARVVDGRPDTMGIAVWKADEASHADVRFRSRGRHTLHGWLTVSQGGGAG